MPIITRIKQTIKMLSFFLFWFVWCSLVFCVSVAALLLLANLSNFKQEFVKIYQFSVNYNDKISEMRRDKAVKYIIQSLNVYFALKWRFFSCVLVLVLFGSLSLVLCQYYWQICNISFLNIKNPNNPRHFLTIQHYVFVRLHFVNNVFHLFFMYFNDFISFV